MNRLSSNVGELRAEYDVVVIGSGYGGSIAASRLARAEPGLSVCLLERGRELHPGEYPDTEPEALEELQVDLPEGHKGSPTGLYDLRVNEDVNVLVGCGLGGTSLINANVCLRATDAVFDDPAWPAPLRGQPRALDPYYERAEAMLQARPYPDERSPSKLRAHRSSARALGHELERPPIHVTFERGTNAAGFEQEACNDCGDCVSGCNVGAKNTVLMNYLPDARRSGAEIFTEVSVSHVERREDGRWAVRYTLNGARRELFDAPLATVVARVVVLAAGTLGSTEILLRSRVHGLPLSQRLGQRFSGNGDVLAFCYNAEPVVNGIGFGAHDPVGREPVGPCITSAIDLRSGPLEGQMILEEGSIPGALAGYLPGTLAGMAGLLGRREGAGTTDVVREKGRIADSLARGAYHGATRHTQTYLVMAHDDADGRLELERDRLRVRWPGAGEKPVFRSVEARLRQASAALEGIHVRNPLWTRWLGHDLITVHPLGGCPMGDDAAQGVVDHAGRVFAGTAGTGVHAGLWVMDGAVLPRSLGVNPLLTISALAERACELLVQESGARLRLEPRTGPLPGEPRRPGVRFTEAMGGWISTEELEDHERAAEIGKRAGSPFRFVLTVVSDDARALLEEPEHAARMAGTVEAPALSPHPLTVADGRFQLLVGDPDDPRTRRMDYRMTLVTREGRELAFRGHKIVRDDPGLDLWKDTTTLFVTLEEGGERVARGILRIAPRDFARQMTTLRVTGVPKPLERLRWKARFGRFFAGELLDTYGTVFATPRTFDPDSPPRQRRALRVEPPTVTDVATRDGSRIRLTRYQGGSKGPVVLSHGLGVSSRIFRLDTVDTNLLEFLFAHGYDVWLLDLRTSHELSTAHDLSSGDDIARHDYPAAVDAVRAATGARDLQFVVHCYGSTTFFMAALAGLEGVRSAVCSQIAAHAVAPLGMRIKTGLHVPEILETLGIRELDAFARADRGWAERLFDRLNAAQPLGLDERCSSATCHRISFLYGLLYEHHQLNRATHETLHETFGVANIRALQHLATIVRTGRIVGADGADVYLPHVARLAFPIAFLHGAENACYLPESTERTLELVARANGPGLYRRHVIPDYGHIDCILGKNAVRDVYPWILEHLEATARP